MKITESITRAVHMTGLKLKARSPEILLAAGVVGAVAGAVMACRATLKLDDILSEASENIERVNKAAQDETLKEKYTEKDKKKDLAVIYVKTGVKVAKVYAPAAAIMGLSVAGILTGHSILRKRNIALAAAYTAVDKSFKEYRKGVMDKFGETVDRELNCGVKATEVTETVSDEKTGEPKEVKKSVEAVDSANLPNEYARFFGKQNPRYKSAPEYNEMILEAEQEGANNLLRARGYLFLNEVYEMLGFKPTKAGQIVGWVYDKKKPSGDNFVDFGIRKAYNINSLENEVGWEEGYILDFNVDGDILDRI